MMKKSRFSARLVSGFSLLLALSAASPDCWAQTPDAFFIGDCGGIGPGCTVDNQGTDFNVSTHWMPNGVPDSSKTYLIQDARTATFSSGSTNSVGDLTVAHDTFGRLRMTGGSLTLLNADSSLEVGRNQFPIQPRLGDYNNNGIVDAADYTVWRDTLGQGVLNDGDGADGDESGGIDDGDYEFWKERFGLPTRGGEVIMTGSSILTTNGAVIGRRTKGLLSVGPLALLDSKGANFTGGAVVYSQDLEVGGYGRAYITAITNEPGLAAEGLVIVEGTVNADFLNINTFGAKGELRVLPGGRVNLNGALVLSHCDTQFFGSGCGLVPNTTPDNMARLAQMSSKLTIIGSGGTINVGKFDADLSAPPGNYHDPLLRRDIRSEFPANATISFTADAGGVTPIVLVDNSAFPGELTGTAYLDGTVGNVPGSYAGMNLQLNLDAYVGASPLTLIDAPPGHLFAGTIFGTVSFLGSRTATVNYDYVNGDVFLNNFQNGAGAGALAGTTVPEPSGLAMITLTLGLCCCFHSVRERNGNRLGRAGSLGKSLT